MRIRKLSIIVLMYLLSIGNMNSQEKIIYNSEHENLKGSVKSMTYELAYYKNSSGKPVKKNFMSKIHYSFDEEGFLTEKKVTKNNGLGKFYGTDEYRYYNGILIEEIEVGFDEKSIIRYNNNGDVTEISNYEEGELKNQTVFERNEKSDILNRSVYESGNLLNRVIYKYETGGNITEKVVLNSKGDTTNRVVKTYTDFGKIDTRITYKPLGGIQDKEIHFYDNNKNCYKSMVYSPDDVLLSTHEYKYIGDEVVAESHYRSDSSMIYEKKVKLDTYDRKTEHEICYYSKDNQIKTLFYITYDTSGNELTKSEYFSFNNSEKKIQNKFDKGNHKSEEIIIYHSPRRNYKTVTMFGDGENIISLEHTKYNKDSTFLSKTTTLYDLSGNILEEEQVESGNKVSKQQYKYSEAGDILEKKLFNGDVFTYEYKFDEKGNWTEKKEIFNNLRPIKVEERVIVYY